MHRQGEDDVLAPSSACRFAPVSVSVPVPVPVPVPTLAFAPRIFTYDQ